MNPIVLLLILLAVSAGATAVVLVLRQSKKHADEAIVINGELYYISTGAESQVRAGRVLPLKGSEDVSSLLELPEQVERTPLPPPDERDFRPEEALNWIADVQFEPQVRIKDKSLADAFTSDWLRQYGSPRIYGLRADTNHWTYAFPGRMPKTLTRLALAWELCDPLERERGLVTAENLKSHLEAATRILQRFGNAQVTLNCPPEKAEDRSRRLHQMVSDFDRDATAILVAPEGQTFEGRLIWDVMLSLGLEWGDGDLFHLDNPGGYGDEEYFSVWTTSPPGYFLPEEIAAGRVHVRNLVFGYSIPRSADPEAVHDAMLKAAQYAQSRLGGTLHHPDGTEYYPGAARQGIREVVQGLKAAGLETGRDEALRLF